MPDRNAPHRHTREPFVMVPLALLYADGVSAPAVRLWGTLDDLARADPAVGVTQAALGRVMRLQPRQVRNLLDELGRAGFVDRQTLPGKASVYWPLRRSRPVHNPLHDPGNLLPGPPARPRQQIAGVGSAALDIRAREEHNARDARDRIPWCGQCEQIDRLVDLGDVVDDRGRMQSKVTVCPRCHPSTYAPWDR